MEVFRLLVAEGKTFSFVAGRRAAGEASEDESNDTDEIANLAQPDDEGVDERGIAQRHSDTKLQTRLTSEGLQKRLLTLYLDAKTLQEEQGVNILYLALGMLKWFEDDKSEIDRFAPLVLIPVALDRGNAKEKFRLRWTGEDPATNVSLAALLQRQFGLGLPQIQEGQELAIEDYFASVAQAVSNKSRWEVLGDDIVLGFFSFAKFLMYRDLDPDVWPANSALTDHTTIRALLGEGFPASEPLVSEDAPIDSIIQPANLTHIIDADSSQTAAIHEARQSRDLVIQGPPGTGKSQTIANIIAASVVDGKKVLFVAEKMAALDVVKRRLDNVGLGDMCLELHSNKTNKRSVLENLRRTWDLGRPQGRAEAPIIDQLTRTRNALNSHPERLHNRHEPSGLSAYVAIGHLVRLRQSGQKATQIKLELPQRWSPQDRDERETVLIDLVERIGRIGLPARHSWRGIHLQTILPTELEPLVGRIEGLIKTFSGFQTALTSLCSALGKEMPNSFAESTRAIQVALRAANAPESNSAHLARECWLSRIEEISEVVQAGERYVANCDSLANFITDAAWETDIRAARQAIAVHGDGWLRWLSGEYKRSVRLVQSLLVQDVPKSTRDTLALLDKLTETQNAAAEIAAADALGSTAFGSDWRGKKSDWKRLRAIVDWVRETNISIREEVLETVARLRLDRPLHDLILRLDAERPQLLSRVSDLFRDLELDCSEAFQVHAVEDISLYDLSSRLSAWVANAEEITRWISYRLRARFARSIGLEEIVDRAESGALDIQAIIPEFEMAYYSALFSEMVKSDPLLGQFDGEGHSRLVEAFKDADKQRIVLAREQTAEAHYRAIPRSDAGAGPIGVLKGEIARRRGHLPIRQLMKRAGPAIQALKPVLMMSPLSVAQFLEPGSLEFDLLVIDEASQVQPVDALGAIARCKKIIVVGDDRQLPPTRFFDRVIIGDDGDDDEDGAGVGSIESILGLCVSKGLPQRMLRWHYRSRHQSLIAVSNSQFYDNKLFIVPSPYTQQAGMGLRFHHIANGVFDSGNTATNPIEARVVAQTIIRHAQEHPELSLGVATFSAKQRTAVLDELERLRRLNPETEAFFTGHSAEPFFIKNLENVQGDERDVIFISVGYGRNAQGYMAMRFGPLSGEGGERRLNVLISRAKRRCEVFSSITDEDIDTDRGRSRGVVAFKLFLQFARTGKLASAFRTGVGPESIFEEQVGKGLQALGYEVHPQVGLAGFFIDLAIADPERPGRYILGIECDGAPYHSSRSARDRDRLRQAVLEDHGWIIHRIWSTDWFNRPQEQLKKAVAAIKGAKAALDQQTTREEARRPVPFEIVTIEREDGADVGIAPVDVHPSLSVPYKEASFSVPSHIELHEVPVGTLQKIVRQVVQIETPIHRTEVVARVRDLWKLQRAGNRIQQTVDRAIKAATDGQNVVEIAGFLLEPSATILVRDRSEVASSGLRRPEMLCPLELRVAALKFIETNLGATRDEAVLGVARLLGFRATSAQLREMIETAINQAIADGSLVSGGDLLRPANKTAM